MLPDRVSNPGPLAYKSGALPIALRGPAGFVEDDGLSALEDGHKTSATLMLLSSVILGAMLSYKGPLGLGRNPPQIFFT